MIGALHEELCIAKLVNIGAELWHGMLQLVTYVFVRSRWIHRGASKRF